MFTSLGLGLKSLSKINILGFRIFKHSSKKYSNFLNLIRSHLHVSSCKNFTANLDYSISDDQLRKYLNFISEANSSYLSQFKEHQKITELLQRKKDLENILEKLKEMKCESNNELKELIEIERKQFLNNVELIQCELLNYISQEDENDDRNVELQIFSGIGGEEAKVFGKELLQMYINYAEFKNWRYEEEFQNGHLLITGEMVFRYLKFEGGVHRVQRVPETEKQNRVHTSTCSVVILPQPKPYEVQLKEKDLIIETMRSSGPGGQNVNKTNSCVRIKHLPSGTVVESQSSRFQYENKKIALKKLRNILFNRELNKIEEHKRSLRKEQAGTSDYADKIRTYNFPQSRITDHRLNYSSYNIKGFLSGTNELDCMINKLLEFQRKKDFYYQIKNTLQSVEYKNFEKKQN